MNRTDVLLALDKLENAYQKLKEGVLQAKDELDRDGVIRRFEFTSELLWKTLKIVLEYNGISCKSPRECIKLAFRHGFIEDDEVLLDILEDRNRTSHIYNEQLAKEIFERIEKVYVGSIGSTIRVLRERV